MNQNKILILDYSTAKVATSELKRWLPANAIVSSLFIDTEESFPDDLIEKDFTHVIHSGSELSIEKTAPFTKKALTYIRNIRDKGVPQFGICYGHQLVCLALVGKQAVRSSPNALEAGWKKVTFSDQAQNILGVGENEVVLEFHFDEVIELPDGSELLATNAHTRIQAYINYEQKLLGIQFHPEFDKESGNKMFVKGKELLKKNNRNVNEIITKGPSIDAGKIFFDFFLHQDKPIRPREKRDHGARDHGVRS